MRTLRGSSSSNGSRSNSVTSNAAAVTDPGSSGWVKLSCNRGASAGNCCGKSGARNRNGKSLASGRKGAGKPGERSVARAMWTG